MRIKIITIIIFIAAIGFVYKYNNSNTIVQEVNPLLNPQHKQVVMPQSANKKKENSIPNKTKSKDKKQKIKTPQIPEDIAQELAQQKYSSEPLLEIATLSILLGNCKTNRSINIKNHNITSKRESQYLEYQENCKKVGDDYPILSQIEKKPEVQMILLGIAMQSEYADFIQRGMALEHMDDKQKLDFLNDSIKILIKSKNAAMIILLEQLPQNLGTLPFVNEISNRLGTIDPSYTKLILSQASVLFSCQFNEGLTCSPTSSYMLNQCFEYESACGLDAPTWFQNHFTPAHNRDIAKIVGFFESQE